MNRPMDELDANGCAWCAELQVTDHWQGKNEEFYAPECVNRLTWLWRSEETRPDGDAYVVESLVECPRCNACFRLKTTEWAANFYAPTYGVDLDLEPITVESAIAELRSKGLEEQAARLSKR